MMSEYERADWGLGEITSEFWLEKYQDKREVMYRRFVYAAPAAAGFRNA